LPTTFIEHETSPEGPPELGWFYFRINRTVIKVNSSLSEQLTTYFQELYIQIKYKHLKFIIRDIGAKESFAGNTLISENREGKMRRENGVIPVLRTTSSSAEGFSHGLSPRSIKRHGICEVVRGGLANGNTVLLWRQRKE
jgi:hypothetical protein